MEGKAKKKKSAKKRKKRSGDPASSDDAGAAPGADALPAAQQLIQHAALGEYKRARKLLKRGPRGLASVADAGGTTALHEVRCSAGRAGAACRAQPAHPCPTTPAAP
jgi:hypothetical protein